MWERLNITQRLVVKAAAAVLVLMIVFPPIYKEAVITGLSSRDGMVGIEMRKFAGWGFIGQKNLKIFAGKQRLKDPDEMSFEERWRFRAGPSLDELRAMPHPKIAYGVLGFEFLLVFLGTGAALYFRRNTTR